MPPALARKRKPRQQRQYLHGSIEEGRLGDDGDDVPREFAERREISSEALEQNDLRKGAHQGPRFSSEKYIAVRILQDVQHLGISETAQVLGLSEANVEDQDTRFPNDGRAEAGLEAFRVF
jgi:DNA-directed RNA polymerase specialized sigma24 family protein